MPIVRQPMALAIWPTALPTDPAAAETSAHSPSFGWPMIFRPVHAVTPFDPHAPR